MLVLIQICIGSTISSVSRTKKEIALAVIVTQLILRRNPVTNFRTENRILSISDSAQRDLVSTDTNTKI